MPNTYIPEVRDFIGRFVKGSARKNIQRDAILVDAFGDSPEMADHLLALVLSGTKTATCTSLWALEHDNEAPPVPGTLEVILDGSKKPRCIIKTVQVQQVAYEDVTAEFARAEGEHEPHDLSDEHVLQHWRDGHWAFFTRTLIPIGYVPTQDMPLIFEHFKVIYIE